MIRGSQINLIVISQWCSVLAQPGGNKQNQVIGHFVCMLSALTLTFTTGSHGFFWVARPILLPSIPLRRIAHTGDPPVPSSSLP